MPGQIISASRRTDIPALYSEWLMRRISAGFCRYRHPFTRQWMTVSLRPEDVGGMVLWTRNLGPLMPRLDEIRAQYPFYVQMTINDYPAQLEPRVQAACEAVAQARELSSRFSTDALVWRFDPIVLTPEIGAAETLARFCRLARQLEGATRACIFSFMSPYRRQRQTFRAAGVEYREPGVQERLDLALAMARIASDHGFSLAACCNADLLSGPVAKAHCVDPARLIRLGAHLPERVPPAPSRPGCGCHRSVDIGAYDLCTAGCLYCYANQSPARALANYARHDPDHEALVNACEVLGD
ncbi:MAG: DUF1848 domain-containing protein [Armatimonadetes bacterium]|nr:DUF1848 domain-containing protein [Armatimonadota bacterium]